MVGCVLGAFQRNRIRPTGQRTEPKILTREEWTRINNHLSKSDEANNASKDRKTRMNLLKSDEKRKEKEIAPEAGSFESESVSKEEIINRAKTVLFENKDYARRLLRGLRFSTVLHERNNQIDFNRRLRYETEVKEKEIKIKLRQDSIKYEEDLRLEKFRKMEKMEKFKKELDEQVLEKREKGRRNEEEKAKEKSDLLKMIEDENVLAKEERVALNEKKHKLKLDIENYTRNESEIRTALKTSEKEEDEANKIYQLVAYEIDKKRRSKEKSRFRIAEKTAEPKDSPINVQSNQDEKLRELLLGREKRKKELLHDLLSGQKMEREEFKRREDDYRRERELSCQRRRTKEEADRFRIRREKEERGKAMKNTMKYYIMQWMEKEEAKRMEKQLESFYVPDFSEENELIRKYCDQILALVKSSKRPLYPIIAAVKGIKKEFGLEREKNPDFLKSNVPIGN